MSLNKSILVQKQKFITISDFVKDSFLKIEIAKEELRKTEKGKLICDRAQLEETIRNLMVEVENLSKTNQQLLDDLKTRAFFQKYHDATEALNKLQNENEALVKFKYKDFQLYDSRQILHTMGSLVETKSDLSRINYKRYFHNNKLPLNGVLNLDTQSAEGKSESSRAGSLSKISAVKIPMKKAFRRKESQQATLHSKKDSITSVNTAVCKIASNKSLMHTSQDEIFENSKFWK